MSLSPEQVQRLYKAMKDDYETFARVAMGHICQDIPDYQHQVYQALNKRYENSAFVLFRGAAKRLSLDTPILTPNGWVLNKSLKIGDSVIGSNGKPCSILSLSSVVKRPLFELTTRDNRSALCDAEHLWTVRKISGGAGYYKGKTFTMTTQELIDKPYKAMRFDSRYNKHNEECFYAIDVPAPIEFNKRDLPIDPYLLGLILGDGSVCNKTGYVRIHSSNYDCEEIKSYISSYNIGETKDSNSSDHGVRFAVNGLSKDMLALGLNVSCKYKFIPNSYLFSSIEQRLLLLQGLMDTDGTCSDKRKGASFSNTSEMLIDNVVELVRSLGGIATKSSFVTNYNTNAFRVSISLPNGMNPFRLKRKADKYIPLRRVYNAITSIKEVGEDFGRCLMVDSPDHLFVVKDYLLTHNSTISKTIQVTSDICFAREPFTVLLSESIDQASKDLISVVDELENNEVIRTLFGNMKGNVWNQEEIEAANGCFVKTKGYGARIRGIKWKNMRITKTILDDYESENNTGTDKQRDAVFDWIEAQVLRAGIPNVTTTQFFGTIVHPEAHLAKIKYLPEFHEPRGFYLEVPISKDGVSAWESRFPMSYVLQKEEDARIKNKLSLWMQEMYHVPAVIGKPRFDTHMIVKLEATFHNEAGITYLETTRGNKIPVNVFIGVDPAISVSEKADSSIFFVTAMLPDSNFVILHVEKSKIKPMDQARTIFKLVDRFNPIYVTIETQGYQGALADICRDMMARGNTAFSIREFKSNKSKNNKWLLGLEPYINHGKMSYIDKCEGIDAFFEECNGFNEDYHTHDDTIDGAFLSIQNAYAPCNFNVDELIASLKKQTKNKAKPLNYMHY